MTVESRHIRWLATKGGNALPSFMDTFLRVEDKANLVVEHQVGNEVKGLYLQVNANGSVWHVNARISIQRIDGG
jgi:hypothetical protein